MDPSGKPVKENGIVDNDVSLALKATQYQMSIIPCLSAHSACDVIVHNSFSDSLFTQMNQFDDHLLSSADKRKVVVRKEQGRPFGLKIRGGQEFKLGIFIVG